MSRVVRRRRLEAAAGLALALAVAAHQGRAQAEPSTEVHGSLDAFAAPGLALAWGVLRGADEAATEVVVRVDADPKMYGSLSVSGVDPFTKASQSLVTIAPVEGSKLVRVPRARFADLPRTEWRLYRPPSANASDAPALVVYYQGVPDTTPEFDSEANLSASLALRIERVQHELKAK